MVIITDSSYKQQSDEDKKLVEKTKPLISDAYDFARKKFRERKFFNDLYYVNDPEYNDRKKEHQAKFLGPQNSSYAEQKICLYAQGITGTDIQPFFIYSPQNNLYASRIGQALTKLFYNDLLYDHYYETNYKTCHHYVVDGFAIEKTWWDFSVIDEPQPPQKQYKLDEYGNIDRQDIAVPSIPRIDRDYACVKSIAPNNLWLDPSARNEKELRYCVERVIVPFSFLKGMEAHGYYKNVDLLKNTRMPMRESVGDFMASVSQDRKDYTQFYERNLLSKSMDKEDPLVELEIMWRPGFFYTIGNDQILLSDPRKMPGLIDAYPFTFYSNYPSNYQFDGLSDFYFNRYLIKEKNKVANMFIDNVHRHLNPMYFINGILPKQTITQIQSGEPNVVVQSIAADAIKEFRPDLPNNSVVALLEMMEATAKDSMSVTDFMAGQSPGSEFRTTGSIQIAAQLSQIRSAVKLQMLANRKRDVGRKLLNLYRTYMTKDKAVSIGGGMAPELFTITNPQLQLDYNIDINIAPAADILRSLELQAMRMLFADFSQIPGFRTNRAALEISAKSGLFQDAVGLFDQDVLKIEMRNAMDAKALDQPPDPAFTGSVAVPSPDAGGSAQTNAANMAGNPPAPVAA